ncbi:N-acetylmuramoyl-L-alanine amidase-like protein [Zopfia rhizophila CBS 207.26]|uniref:N-acetylmuramoyl-L-alanine amidase-like protein n=1 Tax=Zopfia rhizophila CBS 207.26 TaxID=1314779 RepID=A0A6A6DRE2_9PEZI|nr:N-acetylmuramoyl-L-alanine amidase-like protein [Zopfia rhizophila CBS 207.26]
MAYRYFTLLSLIPFLALLPSVSGMYFVSRKEWNAITPKQSYTPMTNAKGVKVHYLGPFFGGRDHAHCDEQMRSVQQEHLNDRNNDWFDIAYNLAVCQHGYVYEGRGKGHRSGANGDQKLNTEHYAVVGFLGKDGVHEPSKEMITGIQDAIAYLRRAGAGNEIKGHRDGFATECPGEELYKLIKDGTLDPGKLWDGGNHTVTTGEDLAKISEKYNIPKRFIIDANDIKAPDFNVKVGQTLKMPARGVPIDEKSPGDGKGKEGGKPLGEIVQFPGDTFFKAKPNSPVIEAMGKRLVEEKCSAYKDGPGPQWTDADQESYKLWQQKLGYTGADANGWPEQKSWDALKVPRTGA